MATYGSGTYGGGLYGTGTTTGGGSGAGGGTFGGGAYGGGAYGLGLYGVGAAASCAADLPASVTTVAVTGKYASYLGKPLHGWVTFTPTVPALLATTEKVFLISAPVTVALDDDGAFTVDLPASGDSDVLPASFRYAVEEKFSDAPGRKYALTVPAAAAADGVDLSEYAPPR